MKYMTVANKETLDSREVAKMVGKDHPHLCRDIRRYLSTIDDKLSLDSQDYFAESTYTDKQGKLRKCYKLTKMGCEMVANKLTGEKGILFTAEYVKRFNEMVRINQVDKRIDV